MENWQTYLNLLTSHIVLFLPRVLGAALVLFIGFWQASFETYKKIKTAFLENNIPVAYSEGLEMGKIGE